MVEDKDPDFPVELYRERVCEAYAAAVNDTTQQEDERIAHAKAAAFQEICDSHVPETLLSKYVHGISANSDSFFQFRNEFTKHLALSSFLSYALFVGDRAPHRILFSRRTGRVVRCVVCVVCRMCVACRLGSTIAWIESRVSILTPCRTQY